MNDDLYLASQIAAAIIERKNRHPYRRIKMFTLNDYVGPWADSPDWNDERKANAERLIEACTILQERMEANGVHFPLHEHAPAGIEPRTETTIGGETYGGFRPQSCPIGAPDSAHKQGLAVDRYDPDGAIDAWLMANQEALVVCGIYIEHPDSTPGWSHWSIRSPGSGHHVFYP